ncbi:MAG TPA: sigma factor, partial [Frankiaceae bacterium]|nr:sigma factor [Frankiaceae bacterium]
MLASRGVDPALNDDIVQEVAVRALDKRVPFTDPNDLYRWAATTARHLHIDHLRCDGRTTYDDVLLAVPDGTDVAHTAERRVALGHVLRAMAGLRPGERAAILDSLDDREARSSQALVRRHRARATLRKAVGTAIGATVLGRLRLRALTPAMRPAAAALVVTPALLVGGGALLGRP